MSASRRYDKALELTRQALALVAGQEYQQAAVLFTQALRILMPGPGLLASGHEHRKWELARTDLHGELGKVEFLLGRLAPARENLERACAGYRHLQEPDSRDYGVTRSNLGVVYEKLGMINEALACHEDSLRIAQRHGEPADSLATSLCHIGMVQQLAGDRPGSDRSFAAAIAMPGVSRLIRAGLLQNAAFHHTHYFEYAQALPLFFQALDEFTALEEARVLPSGSDERAMCLTNIGQLYANEQDFTRALDYQRRALALFERKQPDGVMTATALSNLAGTLMLRMLEDDLAEADGLLGRAIEISGRHSAAAPVRGLYLANRSYVALRRGDPDRALALAVEGIAVRAAGTSDRTTVVPYAAAGLAYFTLGRLDEAEEALLAALRASESIAPLLPDSQDLHSLLGAIALERSRSEEGELKRSRLDRAVECLRTARTVAEQSRRLLDGEPGLEFLFGTGAAAYHWLIDALYQRNGPGDREEAFTVADGVRARGLARMLTGDDIAAAEDPEIRRLIADHQDALRRLGVAWQELAKAEDPVQQAELRWRYTDLAHRAEQYRIRLAGSSFRFGDVIAPSACTVEQVRAALDPGTAFVLHEPTPSGTYAWVIRPSGTTMIRLPIDAAELEELVTTAVQDLEEPVDATGPGGQLADLSTVLLKPLADGLRGAEHVALSPGGVLAYLPFELLTIDGVRLFERCTTSYVPSPTTMVRFGGGPVRGTHELDFVGFASSNDGLKHPPLEVAEIAEIFAPRSLQIVAAATPEAVRADAVRARYVHIASHAFVDDDQPQFSRLVLAPSAVDGDSSLFAFEFAGLRLRSQLVSLSACSTARSRLRPGEGLIGFYRAVLATGTDAALLSLWAVPDRLARVFMVHFYGLIAAGRPAEVALRETRTHFAPPDGAISARTTWAAFILVSVNPRGSRSIEKGRRA
ncbi:CHAT domain-containing protein [Allocatelliglobosispora scoriae]|uniref:CHAT domain-containing protein n=1 Tax=Allocatelliglobosispora scoriae TaxID=643052 RepID=A0A841BIW6_9ACTN|nr:CHAT domain-containing tetratricopeptide repeat protein [Allocatelliglobosispora scoriae]MBB5867136.1 CHAT domain-containing protein [Allocatelliglobosispora scoriae]